MVLLLCGACSEDSDDAGSRANGDGDTGDGTDLSGESGTMGFGNSNPTMTGDGGTPVVDTGGPTGPSLEHCGPGVYRGTYTCDLKDGTGAVVGALAGDVQFDLAIDETAMQVECTADDEFCFDLVIPEGSGTLFGFVLLLLGFETELEGGLDCRTGEFRATAIDGVWGFPVSSDPNDPNAPATVADPPSGTFDGTLAGTHPGTEPQMIEGTWDLTEIENGYNCNGPFTVERLP